MSCLACSLVLILRLSEVSFLLLSSFFVTFLLSSFVFDIRKGIMQTCTMMRALDTNENWKYMIDRDYPGEEYAPISSLIFCLFFSTFFSFSLSFFSSLLGGSFISLQIQTSTEEMEV